MVHERMLVAKTNVFVLGLDELNLETLRRLGPDYRYHQLLDVEHLLGGGGQPDVPRLLAEARQRLEAFPGSVDAIVGYWDFPVSSMVPILCAEYGLPSASLASVVKCEHKYWSRLEQRAVIDENCPRFATVDLDQDDELPEDLDYPVWLKPVKSASSELAFRVGDRTEFAAAMDEIRSGIDKFGEPFEFVLDQLELPPQVAEAGAMACLAEEAVSGRQLTAEGYVFDGAVEVYGVIESVLYSDSPSFLRYEYPSRVPAAVLERVVSASRRVIERIGLDCSTFNIEYFWDPDVDRLSVLEINPRESQSHARLFEMVDGLANHHAMVRLGLGLSPDLPHRKGGYEIAAKWFLRRFTDGTVVRVPTQDEVAAVEEQLPGVNVQLKVEPGDRLSDLPSQDAYSFELADLFIGADCQDELTDTYQRAVELLSFEFEE